MQREHRVRVGRVYDQRTAEDGARVLVDRLWPRGLTKNQADLDEWCKQIAPSAGLRSWYGHDPHRFAEFGRRYRTELDDPGRAAALQHLRQLTQRQPLTLLTAARRADISEAAVLAEQLLDAKTGAGRTGASPTSPAGGIVVGVDGTWPPAPRARSSSSHPATRTSRDLGLDADGNAP